jgi:uncharacterized protein YceK
MKHLVMLLVLVAVLSGCATKNKNDLQKSPCAGPCFETAARA